MPETESLICIVISTYISLVNKSASDLRAYDYAAVIGSCDIVIISCGQVVRIKFLVGGKREANRR